MVKLFAEPFQQTLNQRQLRCQQQKAVFTQVVAARPPLVAVAKTDTVFTLEMQVVRSLPEAPLQEYNCGHLHFASLHLLTPP